MDLILTVGFPILLLVFTYHSPITNAMVAGMYLHAGLSMVHQDTMGLEAYIKYLNENWVDFHWGVGATIAIIAFSFLILQSTRFAKYNRTGSK